MRAVRHRLGRHQYALRRGGRHEREWSRQVRMALLVETAEATELLAEGEELGERLVERFLHQIERDVVHTVERRQGRRGLCIRAAGWGAHPPPALSPCP